MLFKLVVTFLRFFCIFAPLTVQQWANIWYLKQKWHLKNSAWLLLSHLPPPPADHGCDIAFSCTLSHTLDHNTYVMRKGGGKDKFKAIYKIVCTFFHTTMPKIINRKFILVYRSSWLDNSPDQIVITMTTSALCCGWLREPHGVFSESQEYTSAWV